jgi:arsenate reductase (thioredoxin)
VETAALEGVVDRLVAEFIGTFDRETVEQFVASAYELLAASATTTVYLPLFSERFARQRLQAVIRADDHSDARTPAVLFLCVHNAGRSQMALGWFNHLADGRAVAWSGGSEPVGAENSSGPLTCGFVHATVIV